jgi:predicted metal-dependent hydrolase
MEYILCVIIGSLIGCSIVIGISNLFKPNQSEELKKNVQELIRQSEERQKAHERYSKQLDKLLDDMNEDKPN